MGNEQPKKNYKPQLQKQQLEISCIKVVGHLELQRDRRMNQGMQKEKVLIGMINAPQRSKVDEVHKASSIVSDMNYINGCNIVIRYLNIIKDRSMLICDSVGKPENIKELLPFIESVVWAARHLNLNALSEFQNIMLQFFGAQGVDVTSSPQIDQELRKNFETVMPSPEDINAYIVKLSDKTGITLEQINSAGHEFQKPGQQQLQPQQQNNQQGGQGPAIGGYFPPPQNQGFGGSGQQGGGYGQVYNVNVQLPNNQQQPNQQNQFNQPPQSQNPSQQWGNPLQDQQQQQQQWNQPLGQQHQQPDSFKNYPSQQPPQNQFPNNSSQQQQQPNSYPGFDNNNNQQQGLQPQQQQFFQNNQFPQGSSSFPVKDNNQNFNQPPQQNQINQLPQQNANQFNQPPQQQNGGGDEIDSLEARLKRIREGV